MAHLSVRAYAAVSGMIFSVVAIFHLFRLVEHWNVTLGGWNAPLWVSVLGLVVPAYLAFEAFHLARPMEFPARDKLTSH
jgi:hypothetical protein